MNETTTETIAMPVAKTLTLWATIAAGVGVQTWADAASFATFVSAAIGALYGLLLMGEWFWKKLWRPLGVRFGLLKPMPRKVWTPADEE